MKSTRLAPNSTFVMARAFGDEPVKLTPVSLTERAVVAYGRSESAIVGFPRGDVFKYDENLFSRLTLAYEAGEAAKLASLWQLAEPV